MNLHKEIEITLGYLEAVKDDDVRYELIHHLEELLSSVRGCNNKKGETPLTLEELNNYGWFTKDLSVVFSEAQLAKGLNFFGDCNLILYIYVSASLEKDTVIRNLLEQHNLYTKGKKEISLQDGEFYWVSEV